MLIRGSCTGLEVEVGAQWRRARCGLALLTAVCLVAVTLFVHTDVAGASSNCDIRGTWTVKIFLGGSLNNTQYWRFTSGDLSSGMFSGDTGTMPTGGTFGTITATVNGSAFSATNPYTGGGYTATFHDGTVSADGASMSGKWDDTFGRTNEDWTATLPSGGSCGGSPPPGGGTPPPAADPTKRATATSASCNRGPDPGSPFTCFATVADSAAGPFSAPSGTVGFSSSNGGGFNVGPNCTLTSSGSSPRTASCSVTFTSGGPRTTLTATYGGDGAHNGSSGTFLVASQCTNPNTLLVICADRNGQPGVCGPTGTILPQCHFPVDLPTVCGGSGTILPVCQSQGPYIAACGGTGTILPECNHPRPSIPDVCGPSSGTILPACTGANNPITVCGPSRTARPECSFETGIDAKPLDLNSETGELDLTVSCPTTPATARAARASRSARTAQDPCELTVKTAELRKQLIFTLQEQLKLRRKQFETQVFSKYPELSDNKGLGLTEAQVRAFAAFNGQVFETRADLILRRYLAGGSWRELPAPITEFRQNEAIADELTRKLGLLGSPDMAGPAELFQKVTGVGSVPGAPAAFDFANDLAAAVAEYRRLAILRTLVELRQAKITTLRNQLKNWRQQFVAQVLFQFGQKNRTKDLGLTEAEIKKFADFNGQAFASRADRVIGRIWGKSASDPLALPAPFFENSFYRIENIADELTTKFGSPNMAGPVQLFEADNGLGSVPGANAAFGFANDLAKAVNMYYEFVSRGGYLVERRQQEQAQREASPGTETRTRTAVGAVSAAVRRTACTRASLATTRRLTVRRGARRRIRIRFSRRVIQALARCTRRRGGTLPLRLIVAFTAKPRPVVRFVDIPLRVKQARGGRRKPGRCGGGGGGGGSQTPGRPGRTPC